MQCTAEYGVTGRPFDKELDVLNWHPGSLCNILLSLSIHVENGMIQGLYEASMCNSSASTSVSGAGAVCYYRC